MDGRTLLPGKRPGVVTTGGVAFLLLLLLQLLVPLLLFTIFFGGALDPAVVLPTVVDDVFGVWTGVAAVAVLFGSVVLLASCAVSFVGAVLFTVPGVVASLQPLEAGGVIDVVAVVFVPLLDGFDAAAGLTAGGVVVVAVFRG